MEKVQINPERFRVFLQNELLDRIRQNPSYSLRSFAKALRLDSGQLSRILSGKRKASQPTIYKIFQSIPLSSSRASELLKSENEKPTFETIDLDRFNVISDWYHYAILELTKVKGFKSEPSWIAKQLGITKSECQIAIERLKKMGFLKESLNGQYVDVSGDISTIGNPFTNSVFRNLQRQVIRKAEAALETVDYPLRSQTSLTISVNLEDLSEVQKRINKFQEELNNFLERRRRRDEVYHLSVSFYPVTHIQNKEVER